MEILGYNKKRNSIDKVLKVIQILPDLRMFLPSLVE